MVDKRKFDHEDESDSGSQGSGSQGSGQEFHDFLNSNEQSRDDQLSAHDKRIKLGEHNSSQEGRVKNQKDKRDQYKDLRNGKTPLEDFRAQRNGTGAYAKYKPNPILMNAAQFSGENNTLPNNEIDTNNDDKHELRLRNRLEAAPRFNPQLRPR